MLVFPSFETHTTKVHIGPFLVLDRIFSTTTNGTSPFRSLPLTELEPIGMYGGVSPGELDARARWKRRVGVRSGLEVAATTWTTVYLSRRQQLQTSIPDDSEGQMNGPDRRPWMRESCSKPMTLSHPRLVGGLQGDRVATDQFVTESEADERMRSDNRAIPAPTWADTRRATM